MDLSVAGTVASGSRACFNGDVQLDFLFRRWCREPNARLSLRATGREVPLRFVRHPRARRYILRVQPDGTARVTIPRGGSQREAVNFAERHTLWVERQLAKPPVSLAAPPWGPGVEILYRGEPVVMERVGTELRFADQAVGVTGEGPDFRPAIERHLQRLAARELAARTFELAAAHQLDVRRVTVRSQRSRWGSCSARGTISLNWRLIQAPAFVRDYLILHELMHLKEMNHSSRFWQRVEEVCPNYAEAERWLKRHGGLLR